MLLQLTNVIFSCLLWSLVACYSNLATTNLTEPVKVTKADVHGRSMYSDIPRQGRIINDDKISIKGFIPIVGLGEDAVKEPSKYGDKSPQIDSNFFEKYLKNMGTFMNVGKDQTEIPQHMAQPEDQRVIGSALQGLLGNVNSFRKPNLFMKQTINRKSDCVCVPFYMCKNGFLVEQSSPELYPIQRKPHESFDSSPDGYLPIDERSNDKINISDAKFTEEILSRMIGGKSMSDGCGLLRTCCQRTSPTQMVPAEFMPNSEYLNPEMMQISSMYKPSQYPTYKPPSQHYQRPSTYYNPTVRPSYSKPYRPPKLIQTPSHFEPIIEMPIPVPVQNNPQYSSSVSQVAYDKCGTRQSIGINGRVQNLNYHESSTEFGEFPWQVAILKKLGPSDNLYACGGALISSSFVITAAHCIKKFQSQDLKIRLGEWDVHREDEFYPYIEKNVDEILIHPNFSPRNLANDVAILRLDSEIDFNQHPHISPICMSEPFESYTGHRCFVSGWGKNAFGYQGEYQSVLMKVDLPVLDTRVCENLLKRTKLGYTFKLDRSMICAGGESGKDACEGDGGSGLVCDVNGTWKAVGLVSWGLGCGKASVPGVYTNIGHVRPWIDKVVFPFYHNIMAAKSNAANFNDLINERSFGNDNSTILESSQNSTTITTTTTSSPTTSQ